MENITVKAKILTVSKLNKYIKNILEDDFVLKDVFVSGEVSNLKKHSSGHIYFTLKDSKAQINAVMFKSYCASLNFDLKEGMKVSCVGYVSLYDAYGTIQLYVENIFEDGIGTLSKKYEELRNKLEKQGYFDNSHKKEIPRFVRTVAVLTAKDGAAVQDVIRTIKRRNELIKIIVVPTIVQGINSKKSIVDNIEFVNQYNSLNDDLIDVIILGRGGGSIEDLWSFNEEDVVKSIYKSKIPIISCVGHETDFTLSDFVADLRVSTPTAGAEIVSTPLEDIIIELNELNCRLSKSIYENIDSKKELLSALTSRNVLKRPELFLYKEQERLANLIKSLNNTMILRHTLTKNILNENLTKLELLNPIKILNSGYTLTYKDNNIVKNSNDLKKGDNIKVKFADGLIMAKVEQVNNGEKE